MAAASLLSTKIGLEHFGQEGLTDFTGSTAKTDALHGTRRARACQAARFVASGKMQLAGFGSALRRGFHDSIRTRKPSEIMTCSTAYKAMNSVTVVIKAEMGRCSLAAAMGSIHFSLKMSATIPSCRQ